LYNMEVVRRQLCRGYEGTVAACRGWPRAVGYNSFTVGHMTVVKEVRLFLASTFATSRDQSKKGKKGKDKQSRSKSNSSPSSSDPSRSKPLMSNPLRAPSKLNLQKLNGRCVIHVKITMNNTHMNVGDGSGTNILNMTNGTLGFKGPKRASSVASSMLGEKAAQTLYRHGIHSADIIFKGVGSNRNSIFNGLQKGGLKILSLTDRTPVPHNGCKPPKMRRT